MKGIEYMLHGGDVWGLSRKYKIPIDKVIDFSAPINFLGPPPRAMEALRQFADIVKFYPDQNPVGLKRGICNYVGGISSRNIVLGNGSMELIYRFTELFARGWETLIPVPSFTEYERVSKIVSSKPKFVSLQSDFSLDTDVIKGAVGSNTRLLFICNPHSPSGKLFHRDEILDLVNFCHERNIYVVLDENYVDFVHPVEKYTLAHCVDKYENLFVVRSFSKFFGMPGIRMGYGIACKRLIREMESVQQPWCINALALTAAREALKDKEYIQKTKIQVRKEREKLTNMLVKTGFFKVFPSETNFLLVKILKNGVTAKDLKEKLARRGILIRDCGDFRGLDDRYFRVTVRSEKENSMLVDALKSCFR